LIHIGRKYRPNQKKKVAKMVKFPIPGKCDKKRKPHHEAKRTPAPAPTCHR
jgi:hypothetical protein